MLILLYHGVRPTEDRVSPDIRQKHVSSTSFEQQLRFLAKTHRFYSLHDVQTHIERGISLPRNGACITFDDGYQNNATIAAPILKRLGIPATFFVTTGFIDHRHLLWVDRFESAFSQLSHPQLDFQIQQKHITLNLTSPELRKISDSSMRETLKQCDPEERERVLLELENRVGSNKIFPLHEPMTWDQIRQLRSDGFEIGPHTVTHPILSRCTTEQVEQEVLESKRRVEQELGQSVLHFAHPNGQPSDWNPAVMDIIRRAGFKTCSTTIGRRTRRMEDPFFLPRLTVDMGDDFFRFVLTCSGIRSMLSSIKRLF